MEITRRPLTEPPTTLTNLSDVNLTVRLDGGFPPGTGNRALTDFIPPDQSGGQVSDKHGATNGVTVVALVIKLGNRTASDERVIFLHGNSPATTLISRIYRSKKDESSLFLLFLKPSLDAIPAEIKDHPSNKTHESLPNNEQQSHDGNLGKEVFLPS